MSYWESLVNLLRKSIAFFKLTAAFCYWLTLIAILKIKYLLLRRCDHVNEIWLCDSSDSFKMASQALLHNSKVYVLDMNRRTRPRQYSDLTWICNFSYTKLIKRVTFCAEPTVLCVPHLHPSYVDRAFSKTFICIGLRYIRYYDDGLRLALGISPALSHIHPLNKSCTYGWDHSVLNVNDVPLTALSYPLYEAFSSEHLHMNITSKQLPVVHIIGSRMLYSQPDFRQKVSSALSSNPSNYTFIYYEHPKSEKNMRSSSYLSDLICPPLPDLVSHILCHVNESDVIAVGLTSVALILQTLKESGALLFDKLIVVFSAPVNVSELEEQEKFMQLFCECPDVRCL